MSAPRIGTLVHYLSHGSTDGTHPQTCRPALVTAPPEPGEDNYPDLNLVVFTPTGQFHNISPHDGWVDKGGTWHHDCVQGARFIE